MHGWLRRGIWAHGMSGLGTLSGIGEHDNSGAESRRTMCEAAQSPQEVTLGGLRHPRALSQRFGARRGRSNITIIAINAWGAQVAIVPGDAFEATSGRCSLSVCVCSLQFYGMVIKCEFYVPTWFPLLKVQHHNEGAPRDSNPGVP